MSYGWVCQEETTNQSQNTPDQRKHARLRGVPELPDHLDAATLIDYWGGLAYDAYFRHCQGKSIHGEPLPPMGTTKTPAIRAHWYAAANAVRSVVADLGPH